jgi:hypothetical protein
LGFHTVSARSRQSWLVFRAPDLLAVWFFSPDDWNSREIER